MFFRHFPKVCDLLNLAIPFVLFAQKRQLAEQSALLEQQQRQLAEAEQREQLERTCAERLAAKLRELEENAD